MRFLWLVPVFTSVLAMMAFITGYAIAVARGVESAWFSFISDGGTNPPESCVFGQLLNMAAICLAATSYLRHHQYLVFFEETHGVTLGWRRTVSTLLLVLGCFSAFGITLVANFQELNMPSVHFGGAIVAFFGGLVYCWGQVVLAYSRKPRMTPLLLNHLRFLLALISTAMFILYMLALKGELFVKDSPAGYRAKVPVPHKVAKYLPDDPRYVNHLVATTSEWILAICFQLVVLSFAWELAFFEMHPPKLRYTVEKNGSSTHLITPTDLPISEHRANGNGHLSGTNGVRYGAVSSPVDAWAVDPERTASTEKKSPSGPTNIGSTHL